MSSKLHIRFAFADYPARSLWLHLLEVELRSNGEHGLASLVEDRRRSISRFLTPEESKEVALAIYNREQDGTA